MARKAADRTLRVLVAVLLEAQVGVVLVAIQPAPGGAPVIPPAPPRPDPFGTPDGKATPYFLPRLRSGLSGIGQSVEGAGELVKRYLAKTTG